MDERHEADLAIASREESLERFERFTALPMLILSVAIVPLIVVPLLVDLSPSASTTFDVADWMIWAAFAVEYGVRVFLAPQKRRFVQGNLIDLAVVLLPFLRPLRVIRSARALRLLRASRVVAFMGRSVAAARDVLTSHGLRYILLVALAVVVAAGLLIAEVEQGAPGATIHSVGDGLWWAVVTVTTVGYGDKYPVTPVGRGIAVVLMLLGIGLFGALAATLASYFLRQEGTEVEPKIDEVLRRLDLIEQQLSSGGVQEQPQSPHGDREERTP